MREILNNDYKIWIESEGDSTQVYIDRYYSFGTTGANHRERAIEKIPAAINHVDQLIFVENQKRIEGNKPQNTAMAIGRKLLGFKPALKVVK